MAEKLVRRSKTTTWITRSIPFYPRCHHNLQVFSRKDTTLYRENIDAVHRMLTIKHAKVGGYQNFYNS
jgi:uncharacterized protein YjaG (DUF416 family)